MAIENLQNTEAAKKLKELAEKAGTCMFTTKISSKPPFNSRPMSLQECDAEGNLWFISSKESNKNMEIKQDDHVMLQFMNNSDYEYLSIYGEAFIYDDKSTIEDKWSVFANAWFDGKDDPNVSIIRVKPTETYYWDTRAGKLVSLVSFVSAIVMGKNASNDDGVEGTLAV